ncbi:Transposase DDE domain-containing protein [Algoriphagus alkaliphilus]|uniref:Transposase DDE domain-containing protein n=1 Tax=Algoriphagus alkaliphilus TaxID=279824 RepID=A0A1G5YSJ1_9BACT|nr:Transposase DDE domain-containing protein [Algoriphagus alkaliphilus]
MAKEAGYSIRKSKLDGFGFLLSLMFSYQRGKDFSLLDMASFLFQEFGINITKQSLHDRFASPAVDFLKKCLDCLLTQKISYSGEKQALKTHFNRIRIKDSTKFALPDSFSAKYKGYGGALHHSSSMISIQYEYDFLSGKSLDLRLTSGVMNDQSDSADFTHDIQENDLFLRDMGYCTLRFLSKIHSAKAYFLNRLTPQVNIYLERNSKDPVEINSYLKQLKKDKLEYLEVYVFLGKKERVPVRLVVSLADETAYEKRLRKTSKQAKSTGNKVSDKFKARARLNIMVTNVPAEILKGKDIRKVYSLRRQIELIFKTWKSLVTIDEINTKKIHRFECQLYGKLIWIILNLTIFNWLQNQVLQKNNVLCSVWKYFRLIQNISDHLINALKSHKELIILLDQLKEFTPKILYLERKKGKLALNEILTTLT